MPESYDRKPSFGASNYRPSGPPPRSAPGHYAPPPDYREDHRGRSDSYRGPRDPQDAHGPPRDFRPPPHYPPDYRPPYPSPYRPDTRPSPRLDSAYDRRPYPTDSRRNDYARVDNRLRSEYPASRDWTPRSPPAAFATRHSTPPPLSPPQQRRNVASSRPGSPIYRDMPTRPPRKAGRYRDSYVPGQDTGFRRAPREEPRRSGDTRRRSRSPRGEVPHGADAPPQSEQVAPPTPVQPRNEANANADDQLEAGQLPPDELPPPILPPKWSYHPPRSPRRPNSPSPRSPRHRSRSLRRRAGPSHRPPPSSPPRRRFRSPPPRSPPRSDSPVRRRLSRSPRHEPSRSPRHDSLSPPPQPTQNHRLPALVPVKIPSVPPLPPISPRADAPSLRSAPSSATRGNNRWNGSTAARGARRRNRWGPPHSHDARAEPSDLPTRSQNPARAPMLPTSDSMPMPGPSSVNETPQRESSYEHSPREPAANSLLSTPVYERKEVPAPKAVAQHEPEPEPVVASKPSALTSPVDSKEHTVSVSTAPPDHATSSPVTMPPKAKVSPVKPETVSAVQDAAKKMHIDIPEEVSSAAEMLLTMSSFSEAEAEALRPDVSMDDMDVDMFNIEPVAPAPASMEVDVPSSQEQPAVPPSLLIPPSVLRNTSSSAMPTPVTQDAAALSSDYAATPVSVPTPTNPFESHVEQHLVSTTRVGQKGTQESVADFHLPQPREGKASVFNGSLGGLSPAPAELNVEFLPKASSQDFPPSPSTLPSVPRLPPTLPPDVIIPPYIPSWLNKPSSEWTDIERCQHDAQRKMEVFLRAEEARVQSAMEYTRLDAEVFTSLYELRVSRMDLAGRKERLKQAESYSLKAEMNNLSWQD